MKPVRPTPLCIALVMSNQFGRYTWQLETQHGHQCVVESGTWFFSRTAALASARRFVRMYFREPASVEGAV